MPLVVMAPEKAFNSKFWTLAPDESSNATARSLLKFSAASVTPAASLLIDRSADAYPASADFVIVMRWAPSMNSASIAFEPAVVVAL